MHRWRALLGVPWMLTRALLVLALIACADTTAPSPSYPIENFSLSGYDQCPIGLNVACVMRVSGRTTPRVAIWALTEGLDTQRVGESDNAGDFLLEVLMRWKDNRAWLRVCAQQQAPIDPERDPNCKTNIAVLSAGVSP